MSNIVFLFEYKFSISRSASPNMYFSECPLFFRFILLFFSYLVFFFFQFFLLFLFLFLNNFIEFRYILF